MKPIWGPSIIITDKLAGQELNRQPFEPQVLSQSEYQYVMPRIFPSPSIPSKVMVCRKSKEYAQLDLNKQLKHVDWGQGSTHLSLINFVFAKQYVYEYGCKQEHIEMGKVRGRAYDHHCCQYRQFHVKGREGIDSPWFLGNFPAQQPSAAIQSDKQVTRIHRAQICFDFEDPQVYAKQVLKGVKRRARTIELLKYSFYIDNVEIEGAPFPSDRMLQNIKQLVKGNKRFETPIPQSYLSLIVDSYKRTMNEILFRAQVLKEQLPITLPCKPLKKTASNGLLRKQVVFKKHDKIVRLVAKSVKLRRNEVSSKSLLISSAITDILLHFNTTINGQFNRFLIFAELRDVPADKYYTDQQNHMKYCYSAFKEYVMGPITSNICNLLKSRPEGWFRMYSDRAVYEDSKLRRLIVLITHKLTDYIRDKLVMDFERFLSYLTKNLPRRVSIKSVAEVLSEYASHELVAVLRIDVVVDKGRLVLAHGRDRTADNLRYIVNKALEVFREIPAPQTMVLKQIFKSSKLQEGIIIQLPKQLSIENNQTKELGRIIDQIHAVIDQLIQPLAAYQQALDAKVKQIGLAALLIERNPVFTTISNTVSAYNILLHIIEQFTQDFPGCGVKMGFFYIDYEIVKMQVLQQLSKRRQAYRKHLLNLKASANKTFYTKMQAIEYQLRKKAANFEELASKNEKARSLDHIMEQELAFEEMQELTDICDEMGCQTEMTELTIEVQNRKMISSAYKSRQNLESEFKQIRKQEMGVINGQINDAMQTLQLLTISQNSLLQDYDVQNYRKLAAKVEYMRQRIDGIKQDNKNMIHKKQILQIDLSDNLTIPIAALEQSFVPFELLWTSLKKWFDLCTVWLNDPVASFKLHEPEKSIRMLLADLKICIKQFNTRNYQAAQQTSQKYKQQIQAFEPKLHLLKLLKKQGLSKTHLSEIGVELSKQVGQLTLNQAIDLGFLEITDKIQVISNDAWNQFSLENTLTRVRREIQSLKFTTNFYQDRRFNDIPLIVNYQQLVERIDEILNNLQSIRFNPMKNIYEDQIQKLYERSLYVSNSILICQSFQQMFLELHPVFDSTDIAKQMPAENKKFAKILRTWLELLGYIGKVRLVNDACNSQNIYEKVKSIYALLESVKKQLSNYLQQKRKGFNRFYLLTNSEMFDLFSMSSHSFTMHSLIPKLFDSVSQLIVDEGNGLITGVESEHGCQLLLDRPIVYGTMNIESWMNSLESSIKKALLNQIREGSQKQVQNWLSLIDEESDRKYIPQIVYLLFELSFTNLTQNALRHGLGQIKERYKGILNDLVSRKKQGDLTIKAELMLCSLIILSISKIEILGKLIEMKIDCMSDFEYSKIFKARYLEEDEDQHAGVIVERMGVRIEYGCHYLGLYSRLVVTDLTQKMQIVYVLAFKYSLGAAAIGPAGTGKTEMTKEIAKLCGKVCLVYNCSKQFQNQTFIRLLKGLAVTGFWMCFDEFNRLSSQILSVVAEQLSLLQKFRNYGNRMEMSFSGELIQLDPTFQFCVTYNPTYQGRQAIPKPVHELFRNVAVIAPDQLTICVALLLSSGYQMGEELGNRVTKVLRSSREVWKGEQLYDFSLRALRSIVQLSAQLLEQQNKSEQQSVINALKILNVPKMSEEDSLMFHRIMRESFTSLLQRPSSPKDSQKLKNFKQLLSIRDGIILCGEALSGKHTLIQDFTAHTPSYEVATIYHNVLSVEELYGKLQATTKLWSDGYFTQILRSHIKKVETQPDTHTLVVFNGQIYSQWVQNLNTVLDSTRKLSLVSGEIINVPQSFKIIISCTSLGRATPATVSRSGIIIYHPLHYRNIAINLGKNKQIEFPACILDFFTELLDELQDQYILRMSPRFIIYWTVELLHDMPVKYETFIYFLTQIMTGILNEKGIGIYDRFCRRYLPNALSPFDIMLRTDGKIVAFTPQFQKHANYQKSISDISQRQETDSLTQCPQQTQTFSDVFILTPTAFKIRNYCESYIRNSKKKVLLLFGSSNSCKTRSALTYLQSLPKDSNEVYQLFLTKNTSAKTLQTKLRGLMTRKSSIKLGAKTGFHNSIFIEDLNMPQHNQYHIYETSELIRMLMSTQSWYNCREITRQWVEDVSIISDSEFDKHIASVNKDLGVIYRLYRHIEPVFTGSISTQQIRTIFRGIVQKMCGKQSISLLQMPIETILSFYESLTHTACFRKSMLVFSLMDLLRALKGFVTWNYAGLKLANMQKLALFELSRTFLAKAANKPQQQEQIYNIMKRSFTFLKGTKYSHTQIPIFHNLQAGNPSPQKCEEVVNMVHFTNEMQQICDEYRLINKVDTNIILFPHLITYLVKLYRTLGMDDSHVLIAGLSKCGKKILIQLATYILSLQFFPLPPVNDQKQWGESIKRCLKGCYRLKNQSLLMIEHGQIESEYQVDDINSLLNNMDLSSIYSQADMEETSYMMQTDLVRKNIQVTSANAWKQFTRYLVCKLHIAILLNPSYQSFVQHIQNYPAILKHCTCFYLTEWPEEALSLIAELYLSDLGGQLPRIHSFLPRIHSFCAALCYRQQSTLPSIWQGMYFDFITKLREQYDYNHQQFTTTKQKYEKGLQIIEQTQEQLKATKNKIKKLQPAMILIESETAKTVKNLNMQKNNAETANQSMTNKTAELDQIITNSKKLKGEIEAKVQIVNQQLKEAWESVSLIKPSHISEVKALANPSELIKLVLAALVILTYDGPLVREVVERDGHQYVEYSYFETAKKFVLSKDAKSICRLLTEFKREAVTKQMFVRLQQKCLSYKRWEQKQAKNANKAIYYFFIWVQAVACQYRIFEETQPLRDSLQSISNLLAGKEKQVSIVRKQLEVTQQKIFELEQVHSAKKQALQQYRFQIAQFEHMLSRGYELLKEISQEKLKWKQYIEQIGERSRNNFGDSVLMVATIVYLSYHVYEIRNMIKSKIKSLCAEYGISCGTSKLPWFLSREETLAYHTMQVSENQFIIDNMKVISHSAHTLLLLDPEEQGVKYVKNYNWQTDQIPVDKLSQSSPLLARIIESAIAYGRIVFIEVDPSSFNQSLAFVLKPTILGNQLKIGEKTILMHKQWRIYLYATTYTNKKCSMQLLANVRTVNFKMTSQQLQQRMMQAVITVQLPLLKSKIEQIYRINIKDTVNLSNIEQKLLLLFSKQATAEQILESEEIINTVIHSNRLYEQISDRVKQSNKQKQQIIAQLKPYESKVRNACQIYQNIMHLKSASSLYAYSYQWFIELFDMNLHNFEEVLFREVAKALRNEDKIIVAILLAEVVYSNLPWKCLFGAQNSHSNQPQADLDAQTKINLHNRHINAPVAQQKWDKILHKIRTVREHLPGLQQCFVTNWSLLKPILESAAENILSSIPNQFSNQSFFNKILLISCFRQDCVIELLTQWISVNMGPSYTDFTSPLGNLVGNTKPSRPILAILDDTSMDGVEKVRQISREHGSKAGISIASIYWEPAQTQEFGSSMKSAVELDQWLVIEGVSTQATQFIKNFFEDLIILPEKTFRCWIICDDSKQFPERFTQFCDKVRIISTFDYQRNIVSSFYRQVLTNSQKEADYFQRNKKRMIGSQLCILHHLIQQFNSYNARLFRHNSAKSLYAFTQWDLKLVLQEIAAFPVTPKLKAIAHFLVSHIAHGSQMRAYHFTKLLQVNCSTLLESVQTDRILFFQTIWSNEKFPKDQANYLQEVTTKIRTSSYEQIFGINALLIKQLQEQSYRKICLFYEHTGLQHNEMISELVRGRLQEIKLELQQCAYWEVSKQLRMKLEQIQQKCNPQSYVIYYHLKKEVITHFQCYEQVVDEVERYLRLLDNNSSNLIKEQTFASIYGGRTPKHWLKSNKKISPIVFARELCTKFIALSDYLTGYQNSDYAVNCNIIMHPFLFLHTIESNLSISDKQNTICVFEPIKDNKMSHFLTEGIEKLCELNINKVFALQKLYEQRACSYILLSNMKCWNIRLLESDNKMSMNLTRMVQSDLMVSSHNESFGAEIKVSGVLLALACSSQNVKKLQREYVCLPLYLYAIEDVLEESDCVRFVYMRQEAITQAEVIREKCHLSFQR